MKHNHIKMIRLYNNNNNANHYHFGWLWHHFREKVRNQIEVCRKSCPGLSGHVTIIRSGPFKPMSLRWLETEWSRHLDWDVQCPGPGDQKGWQPVSSISRHPWHRSRATARLRPVRVTISRVCTLCTAVHTRDDTMFVQSALRHRAVNTLYDISYVSYVTKCKMWLGQ